MNISQEQQQQLNKAYSKIAIAYSEIFDLSLQSDELHYEILMMDLNSALDALEQILDKE